MIQSCRHIVIKHCARSFELDFFICVSEWRWKWGYDSIEAKKEHINSQIQFLIIPPSIEIYVDVLYEF